MAKKVQAMVKLQIAAGKATPAPPVGTALGPHGLNIMDFCKNFNAKTAKDEGLIIPVVVTVYADRSYSFITKTPPAAILLKRAANLAKGSNEPNKNKVGTVTRKQVEDIVLHGDFAGGVEDQVPHPARAGIAGKRKAATLDLLHNDLRFGKLPLIKWAQQQPVLGQQAAL